MKVAWIQDYSREYGGAELSNKSVVAVGFDIGHDIVGITPSNFPVGALRDCDVAIVNNFFEFTDAQRSVILDTLWGMGKPYVKYEHDSRELKRKEFAKELFGKSRLNVFISPAHRKNHVEALGCEGVVFPLAVDAEFFRPLSKVDRKAGTAVIVGGYNKGGKISRSIEAHIRGNPGTIFTSIGHPIPGVSKVTPILPHKEMPRVYSEHEELVHLPDFFCAGERVVFEAALCGCRVIGNGNVGHLSWGYDLSDIQSLREILRKAPFDFWKSVEAAASRKRAA